MLFVKTCQLTLNLIVTIPGAAGLAAAAPAAAPAAAGEALWPLGIGAKPGGVGRSSYGTYVKRKLR